MRISSNQYDNYKYLNFATAVLVGDDIWVPLTNYNGLCKINIETLKKEYVISFEEELLGMELYSKIIHVNSKLYIIPGRAKNIAIYDMRNNTIKYLHIKNNEESTGCKFSTALKYNQYIYLFPQCLKENYIYKINTDNQEIEHIVFSSAAIDGKKEHADRFCFGVIDGDYAWIALGNRSGIARFNFCTEKLKIFDIKSVNAAIRDISIYNNKLLILDWESNITEYNVETATERRIWTNINKIESYSRIICAEKKIWLLPLIAEQIVKIDIYDLSFSNIKLTEQCKTWLRWNGERGRVIDYMLRNKKIYLWPFCLNCVIILDIKKECLIYKYIYTEEKLYKKLSKRYAKKIWKPKTRFEEEKTLEELVRDIVLIDSYETKSLRNSVGEKIYMCLRQIGD